MAAPILYKGLGLRAKISFQEDDKHESSDRQDKENARG